MSFRPTAILRMALAGVLAAALAGCISLVPKEKPSQLYRFEAGAAAEPPAAAPATGRIAVYRAAGTFQREAAGDRLLTLTGERAAFIAQARWVAPAEVLFDEAVQRAFDASGKARLVSRGEPSRFDYALRLDVRNFETHYEGERPTVLVRVRAVLVRTGRREASEHLFEAAVPARENRVSAIVAAYGEAVGQVLKALASWVDASITATP
jgi:cholesterol transport system auxiliary component